MSIFWIIYCFAALTVTGIIVLLVRADIKAGRAVTITLKEGLMSLACIFCPALNIGMAIAGAWYFISVHGSDFSITFGKGKEPK